MTDQEAKGRAHRHPADHDPLLDPVAAVRNCLTGLHALGIRVVAKERGDYVTGDAVNDWVRSYACQGRPDR
uniref:hypothetical protein n=1 Tax=Streptomyces sp. NRRL B-24051 TaxID=1463832 RepID=UPI000B03BB37|nr:hypothetical protein [Streptomyces sp. NRRL B-24051]